MRCHNCGTDNPDDETFCAVCGFRIIERGFREWTCWRNLSLEEKRIAKMCIAACGVLLIAVLMALTVLI
ncbi:MAG: zinc-ribbon domain-containing protein [Methanomassiliicoccales archaeon]|nr:zinc-ribbon domain-containing protein [Methanomassiliicoccales archaeon]